MYFGDSRPEDETVDGIMAAIYQQLDDHVSDGDYLYDIDAGLEQLTERIHRERARSHEASQLPLASRRWRTRPLAQMPLISMASIGVIFVLIATILLTGHTGGAWPLAVIAAVPVTIIAAALPGVIESIYARRSAIISAKSAAQLRKMEADTRHRLVMAGLEPDRTTQAQEMLRMLAINPVVPEDRRLADETMAKLMTREQPEKLKEVGPCWFIR